MSNPPDPRAKEAVEFIETVTGGKVEGDFQSALKSGVLLCQLLNKLQPNSISRINTSKMPFKEMENVDAYIKACATVGVPSQYSFMTVDLYEAKNLNQVVQNIMSLKRQFGYGFEKQSVDESGTQIKDYTSDQSTEGSGVSRSSNPVVIEDSKVLGIGLKAGIKELKQEQLSPECATCGARITSSFVNACLKSWHPTCFTCKRCGVKLVSSKYFEDQGKPYCDKCHFILKPHKTGIVAQTKDMGFSFE